ncbi:MAG: cupin [Pseudomonadota bacterium]
MSKENLGTNPIHLGLGATALVQPTFTGQMEWYEAYGTRNGSDGKEGRLVSMHTFTIDWDTWEMHPVGSEVVLCVDGAIVLHQEAADGSITTVSLEKGEYTVNPPGVWHTADIENSATAVFITAGEGTEIRPR